MTSRFEFSRREFVMMTAAGLVSRPRASLTAQDVVDRIKLKSGIEWKADGVDTFKAGDPATPVKGIAVTTIATLPVLRQAVRAGANLVITGEPTFYSKADTATPPAGRRGGPPAPADAIFTAKNEFIKSNGLVIWRFDHWRQRKPDPFAGGLASQLGWSKFATERDPSHFSVPATSLEDLASGLKRKLNARGGIRVVGDPKLTVRRVGLLPGTTSIQPALNLLPIVDALIAGEVREWESVEYGRDKVTAGEKKSLILVGRIVSEEPGMDLCARWIKTIVPETTTTWIPVGDPYWRPA